MAIDRLVVNGCSYMWYYHCGGGSQDLCSKLSLSTHHNLAEPGECNNSIIREVLRDSYQNQPTFYVLGLTFVSRTELPLGSSTSLWRSTSNSRPPTMHYKWSVDDDTAYSKLWQKAMVFGVNAVLEDLWLKLLCLIDSLTMRGHRVLIFNTAEYMIDYQDESQSIFSMIESRREIIDALRWKSIQWQSQQGARFLKEDANLNPRVRHIAPGEHKYLNGFLVGYIQQHSLLT